MKLSPPTLNLIMLILALLALALVVDMAQSLFLRVNTALQQAAANLTVSYTQPALNPRWAADQLFDVLITVAWILCDNYISNKRVEGT